MEKVKIPLSYVSALPFDFGGAVDKYIKDMMAHRHAVEGEPAPTPPHPSVEFAVARVQYPIEAGKPDDFVPNFEVVDDSPPPPSLDERKFALANSLTAEASKLIAAILPPLKQDLWALQHNDAAVVDEKKRTAAQKAILQQHEDRQNKVRAIHMHLAQMKSDIHDLTESTIKGWKAAPFPT